MANRRMIAREVFESDAFTRLPLGAQALYPQLMLHADDDGLFNCAIWIQKAIGATPDDLEALIEARYVLDVGEGVMAITHWRAQNAIKGDRYTPTTHIAQAARLRRLKNHQYCHLEEAENLPESALDLSWHPGGVEKEPSTSPGKANDLVDQINQLPIERQLRAITHCESRKNIEGNQYVESH